MELAQAVQAVEELQLTHPAISELQLLHVLPLIAKPAEQLRHCELELQVRHELSTLLQDTQLPLTTALELLAQAVHTAADEQLAQPLMRDEHVPQAEPDSA